jgi:hypothetical protein
VFSKIVLRKLTGKIISGDTTNAVDSKRPHAATTSEKLKAQATRERNPELPCRRFCGLWRT